MQIVGTSESTISRELKRNVSKRTYSPCLAQEFADERKERFGRVRKFSKEVKKIICDKLESEQRSAEQIVGWRKKDGIQMVSHERICQYIREDKQNGGNLYKNGLIRQYIPKNQIFENINNENIMDIQHKINRRPRKGHNFENPKKLFFHKIALVN